MLRKGQPGSRQCQPQCLWSGARVGQAGETSGGQRVLRMPQLQGPCCWTCFCPCTGSLESAVGRHLVSSLPPPASASPGLGHCSCGAIRVQLAPLLSLSQQLPSGTCCPLCVVWAGVHLSDATVFSESTSGCISQNLGPSSFPPALSVCWLVNASPPLVVGTVISSVQRGAECGWWRIL